MTLIKSTDTRPGWKFFTYDPCGRDVVIPVRAESRDEAIEYFNSVYGSESLVDFIKKA